MPEYLSPGVYVEEIDAGPKPIEGVSTSTAGAVGVTAMGPTSGKPELVTSFAEFTRKFGGFLPEPDAATVNQWALNPTEGGRWWQFPLTVKGFFENGGQRLYIKRVFAASAVASAGTLGRGLAAEIEQDAGAAATTVKLRHLFNIGVGSVIDLVQGDTGVAFANGPFTVSAYNATTRIVTLTPTAGTGIGIAANAGRGDKAVIQPIASTGTDETLAFAAKALGAWGEDLSVRVRAMAGASYNILNEPTIAGAVLTTSLTVDAVINETTLDVASNTGVAATDVISINGQEYTVTGTAAGQILIAAPGLDSALHAGATVRRLRRAYQASSPGAAIRLWGAATLYPGAMVELDNGALTEMLSVVSVAGELVTLSGNMANDYWEGHKLRVVEAEVSVVYAPDGVVQAREDFGGLRLVADGSMSYLIDHVNQRSKLVQVASADPANFPLTTVTSAALFPSTPDGGWLKLSGGDDDIASLSPDDFVGVDAGSGKRTGIASLEDIDEISICLAPGMWSASVHSALIIHCESLKDRFAVLDPQDGLSIEGIRSFREPLDTKYAALYYPWVEVRDPSRKRNVEVAPSAHMAGVYARVDVERGVHKAPANEVIRGITKIAQDVTKREHDMLNPKNINVLRYFPGRGNRIWGARCVTSDAAWKYVNVRRLFIYVEESIDEGTQWVVFEPNDEPLWARVRQTINNFLLSVWRSGALQGAKADEAFFVKCDHSTMTQDDIDNGRLICQIGIAPVKPAEFVIFRIQQKTIDTASS
jgi:phage tail sheath protein FI